MQHLPPGAGGLCRPRLAAPPAEAGRVERERRGVPLRERALLVAEDGGGEEVQEAVLAVVRDRMVEPCRRLENEAALAARADEPRELLDAGSGAPPQRTFAR